MAKIAETLARARGLRYFDRSSSSVNSGSELDREMYSVQLLTELSGIA
jgi:hypothetical protein